MFNIIESFKALLDTRKGRWRTWPSLNALRCRPSVVYVKYAQFALVAGGSSIVADETLNLDSTEFFFETSDHHWTTGPVLPCSSGDGLSLVSAEEKIFAVGGLCTSYNNGEISCASLCSISIGDFMDKNAKESKPKWKIESPMRDARRHHGCALLGDGIYVVGGIGSNYASLLSCEKFNCHKMEWFNITALPMSARSASFVTSSAYNGLLHCLLAHPKPGAPGLSNYEMLVYDERDSKWHRDEAPSEVGICQPSIVSVYD